MSVAKVGKDPMAYFVDEKLVNGELIMQRSPVVRQAFVDFIKSGVWTEKIEPFEEFMSAKISSDAFVWVKYGYKSPKCSSPARRFLASATRSLSDLSSDFSCIETESTSGSVYQRMVHEESYGDITNSDLFDGAGLRAVLFAVLLPIYLSAPERADTLGGTCNSKVGVNSNSTALSVRESGKMGFRKRSERLQDWLLGAAAMSDSTQIADCLADASHSWVDEFKTVLSTLPVTVYLSAISDREVESRVVYCNSVDKVLFRERCAIGANLHDIFSLRCSSYEAELVHRAVFQGKPLKLCILTDTCTLRALKPLHDAQGNLKYMLGIESRPFSYPVHDSAVCEKPFHQLEVMLNLLPMLVKFPMYT